MNKTTKIYLIALLSAIMVCLLTTPVMADYNFDGFPVQTRTSGIVNGGVFVGCEPWAGTRALTGNFDVPNGAVKWARLYTGIWGATEDYEGWVNVTFNGVDDRNGLGQIHLQGKNDVNPNVWCSTHGKYWMWYNVTDLVNAGSVNTATTTKINATIGSFDGRVYGIVLAVVYEGGDSPKDIQYWINDGSDGLHYFAWPYPACDTGTTYFNDTVNKDIVSNATLTMVHLTAYEPGCDSCLKFNDNSLDTNMVDSNTFELNIWDVTSYVASSGNNAWYSRGEDAYVSVCNAILVLEREVVEKPDLNVTSISVNCDCLSGNESNDVCATVKNNGTADAGAFNVCFNVDGFREEVRVRGLAAGANTTVCVTDPTRRNAGDSVAINVTADCDDEVVELDETNNEMSTSKMVVSNGYKGKRYTGGGDLKTLQTHTLKGNIVYSTGDSYYLSASAKPHWTQYTANWNESDISVPKCATIEKARLYVYYTWDKTPGSNITDFFSLSFNGNSVPSDKIYTDRKGYGYYDYPSGMLAYNVTADFNSRGNTAVLTNSYPGGDRVSMQGMLLAVIYADSSEQKRTIWINEECDILAAKATYCTTPEEATAYAPFDGTINLIGVEPCEANSSCTLSQGRGR